MSPIKSSLYCSNLLDVATCHGIFTLYVVLQLYNFPLAKLVGGWDLLFDPLRLAFGCFQCLNWTWAFLYDCISV